MRYASYCVIGIFSFLVQATVIPYIFKGAWAPNLLFVWVVMLALLQGRKQAMVAAIVAGIVQDVVISNFFGLHLIPNVIIAYIFSMKKEAVFEEQWYLSFVLVVVASAVEAAVRIEMLVLGHMDIAILPYIWHTVWPTMWFNGLVAIVLHEILWNMEDREQYIW